MTNVPPTKYNFGALQYMGAGVGYEEINQPSCVFRTIAIVK